jgi:hypothetical protein
MLFATNWEGPSGIRCLAPLFALNPGALGAAGSKACQHAMRPDFMRPAAGRLDLIHPPSQCSHHERDETTTC